MRTLISWQWKIISTWICKTKFVFVRWHLETASSSSCFLKSIVWLCCIGCWIWIDDVSSDEQSEQKNIFSDWWLKTKFKKYFNFWLYACVFLFVKVAKAQQPIVTSNCLHVHLSGKRQRGVYHSPLSLVWHYKQDSVSVYTWRHKLGNYTRLNYRELQWWRQRQAWALPPIVWPTNHNGASYFLRITRTWPCIFEVSAVDSNCETSYV